MNIERLLLKKIVTILSRTCNANATGSRDFMACVKLSEEGAGVCLETTDLISACRISINGHLGLGKHCVPIKELKQLGQLRAATVNVPDASQCLPPSGDRPDLPILGDQIAELDAKRLLDALLAVKPCAGLKDSRPVPIQFSTKRGKVSVAASDSISLSAAQIGDGEDFETFTAVSKSLLVLEGMLKLIKPQTVHIRQAGAAVCFKMASSCYRGEYYTRQEGLFPTWRGALDKLEDWQEADADLWHDLSILHPVLPLSGGEGPIIPDPVGSHMGVRSCYVTPFVKKCDGLRVAKLKGKPGVPVPTVLSNTDGSRLLFMPPTRTGAK